MKCNWMVIEASVLLNICFELERLILLFMVATITLLGLYLKTKTYCLSGGLTLKCIDIFVVGNGHYSLQQLLRKCCICSKRMRSTITLFARNTQEGRANLHSVDLIGRRNPGDRICWWVTGVSSNQHSDSTAREAWWREKTHNSAESDTRCSALTVSQRV